MLKWYDYATTFAERANAGIDVGPPTALAQQLASECIVTLVRTPNRYCLFSDMASLMAGQVGARGLSSSLAAYTTGSFEQISLAAFGGHYFYSYGDRNTAHALWSRYLPDEMLIHRAHITAMSDDWTTPKVLLESVSDKRHEDASRTLLGQVLVEMANQAFAEEAFGEAEYYWRRAITQWPDRPSYYVALARVVGRQGRWEDSASILDEAIRLRPDYAPYHVYKAQALLHAELLEDSAAAAQRALLLEPDNQEARHLMNQIEVDR